MHVLISKRIRDYLLHVIYRKYYCIIIILTIIIVATYVISSTSPTIVVINDYVFQQITQVKYI